METVNKHQYAIGVVARRTQTHPETIRVWERRYELIVPGRSESGRRLYSEDDIIKLSLVKQLTELGHSVSSLARLTTDELRAFISASSGTTHDKQMRRQIKRRVIFINDSLRRRLSRDLVAYEDIVIVDHPKTKTTPASAAHADILIIDLATINEESLPEIRRQQLEAGCTSALVLFNFATRKSIVELERAGIACLKGSVTAADIHRACTSVETLSPSSKLEAVSAIAPPRFDKEQLARISALTSTIACECPNHIAELLINLGAFEQYSSECANRNEADAQLHAQLNQSAGAARVILEESLARLIEIEGIEI
jgi:DNA-binding transcriptional MerR regulator